MTNMPIPVVMNSSAASSTGNAPTNGTPNVSSNAGQRNLSEVWNIVDHETIQHALHIQRETTNYLSTVGIPYARLMGMSYDSQRALAANIMEQNKVNNFVSRSTAPEPTINPRLLEPSDRRLLRLPDPRLLPHNHDMMLLETNNPVELLERQPPKMGHFSQNVRPRRYRRNPALKSAGSFKLVAGGRPGTRLREATHADEMEGEYIVGSGDETDFEDWSIM